MQALQQSISSNNPNNSHAAAPPASSLTHPHAHRGRSTQRVFVKDRPETICQLQINQIAKLNQQLAAYKNQYRMAPGSNIEHNTDRHSRRYLNAKPLDSNQTVKNILKAGEAYRSELLAAQQRMNREARQSAAIQRNLEAFSQERQAISAELYNEKSKNSILEQELFMVKDAFGKYKSKIHSEKHEYAYQIKNLRTNMKGLETVIKELTPKANLLPFYEQKVKQNEYKMGLMSQELTQLRGDLRYNQQKSNYFENNYQVLNENFNNLYNNNLNLTNQLKQTKSNNDKIGLTIKSVEEECKRLNSKIFELSEQKNKLVGQLSGQIAKLSQRIKGEHSAADRTEKVNEKLNTSLDQFKRIARELQAKNEHLCREIESKSTIIHRQKVLNEQLQSSLKELQQNLAKKEYLWKQILAAQIVKLSNQSREKAVSISSELIKSSENAKFLSVGLARSEQQLEKLRQKATKLEKQLDFAQYQIQQKERTSNTLKDHYQQAKIEIISLKKLIKDYETRLNVALSVQEQINTNSQGNLSQKTAKIKQLQAKIEHLSDQNVKLQLHVKDLLEQISKFTEISNILKSQLEVSREDIINLEQQLKGEITKSTWLMDQNNLKEQIIAKYNSVSEEMRAKIKSYYNNINELNEKNLVLEESLSQAKQIAEEKQAQIILKAKLLTQNSQKSLQRQRQAQQLIIKIADLQKEKALLHQRSEDLTLKTNLLSLKLKKSQNSIVNLQISLKERLESLIKTHEVYSQKLKEEHREKLQESERISSNELQNKNLVIDVCRKQIDDSISKLNKEINEKNKLQTNMKQLTSSFEKLQDENIGLKIQIQVKRAEIQQIIKQRYQMAQIIQKNADNILKLKASLIQLDQTYRYSIEEGSKKNEQKKNTMITQWKAEKQLFNSKIEEGNSHLQRKKQLEQQLKNSSILNHNLNFHLQGEQIRVQNLTLENQLLRKSIKQIQQTYISKLQQQIQLKLLFEQKQFDRLKNQNQKIIQEKKALKAKNDDLHRNLSEVTQDAEILSVEKQQLQKMLKIYLQSSRSELQYLKKNNVQLQVQLQSLLQANQNDSRMKNDLSQSISALQIRNTFLEEYMKRTQVQIASIQSIFQQLKEQRELLVKMYIVLSNEINKINSKDVALNRELESFAQYFSKVSALHTQINKHLFNITHLSQPTVTKVRYVSSINPGQNKKMEESFVQKIN